VLGDLHQAVPHDQGGSQSPPPPPSSGTGGKRPLRLLLLYSLHHREKVDPAPTPFSPFLSFTPGEGGGKREKTSYERKKSCLSP